MSAEVSDRRSRRLRSRAAEPPTDDQSLLARLRTRDEQAFVELLDRHHRSLVRLATIYVGSRAEAEEVAQETWLAVLQGLDRFEGRSSLRTWIFRILVNRARTHAVRAGRTVPFSRLVNLETESSETAVDPTRFRPADDRWPGHWATPPASWGDLPESRLLSQ